MTTRLAAGTRRAAGSRLSASGRASVPLQQNLVLWSQDWTQASWDDSFVTVSATGVADPLGGTNAQQISSTVTTGTHQFFPNTTTTLGIRYTSSCWFKAVTSSTSWLNLGVNNGSFSIQYNPVSGVFETAQSPNITATSTSWGNGWYRVAITYVSGTTGEGERFIVLNGTPGSSSYLGTGNETVYVFGFQRNIGDYATPYKATTTAAFNTGNPRWALQ